MPEKKSTDYIIVGARSYHDGRSHPCGEDACLGASSATSVRANACLRKRAKSPQTIASAPVVAKTAKLNQKAAYDTSGKAIEYERDLQTICFATEDALERRAAFKEKRAQVFLHR